MNLQLSLKKTWFEMTKSGEKTEDYREITEYWAKRFIFNLTDTLLHRKGHNYLGFVNDNDAYKFLTDPRSQFGFKDFKTNIMTLGYPKKTDLDRILKLEHKGIEIRTGDQKWGAEPNKLYFVVKHGVCLNEA